MVESGRGAGQRLPLALLTSPSYSGCSVHTTGYITEKYLNFVVIAFISIFDKRAFINSGLSKCRENEQQPWSHRPL